MIDRSLGVSASPNHGLYSRWLTGLVTVLLATGLGYVINFNPGWLGIGTTGDVLTRLSGLDLTQPEHLVAILTSVIVLFAILKVPEIGLLALVALIYTHASAVAVRAHGLPSILDVLIPVLIVGLAWRQLEAFGPKMVWHPTMIWFVGFGAVILLSAIGAVTPKLAYASLLEYAKALLIMLLVINLLRSRETLYRVVWVLVLVGGFLGTLSVYQVLTSSYGSEFGGFARIKFAHVAGSLHDVRVAGPVGDPNFYAQTLVFLIPMALYRVWDEPSRWWKLVAAYSLVVSVWALFLTYSRGAVLALGLVLFLAVIKKLNDIRYLAIGLLMCLPLVFVLPGQLLERMSTLGQLMPGESETTIHLDTSIQVRIVETLSAWRMFLDHPVLGVGAGNYREHFDEYASDVGLSIATEDEFESRKYSHSLYLELASEMGLVGLLTFLGIMSTTLLLFRSARRDFEAVKDLQSARVAESLALGFIGYLTTSLFLHGDFMRQLWVIMAFAIAARNVAGQQRSEQGYA